jgi:mannose-6-phosphate isomerase-like protein (cupin superfamily)
MVYLLISNSLCKGIQTTSSQLYQESYYVVSENPNAVIYLNGKIIALKQDDVIYIAPGTRHKIKANSPKDLKIYVVTDPPWSEGDHHLDE